MAWRDWMAEGWKVLRGEPMHCIWSSTISKKDVTVDEDKSRCCFGSTSPRLITLRASCTGDAV
jgi:hypothetical protein